MQCPACNSASPDNVRFCLHCGQYVGEPDEVTRARYVPPTTIRANFSPPAYTPQPQPYEAPEPRRWPVLVAAGVLVALALMFVGGVIALALLSGRDEHPATVRAANETRATPTATPTKPPPATPTPRIEATQPAVELTPRPMPTVFRANNPTPESGPQFLGHEVVRVQWSNYLKDGARVQWNVAPGYYRLHLTSSTDGARVVWSGTGAWTGPDMCGFETTDVIELNQQCKVVRYGTLTVWNPTRFGLGAPVLITLSVNQL